MGWRKYLGGVSMAVVAGTIAAGCSSKSDDAPVDAGSDSHATRPDAGPVNDLDANNGDTCAPSDESSFVPTWIPPNPRSTACTTEIVAAYHTCLKDSTPTNPNPKSCAPFDNASTISAENKACLQCILSDAKAKTFGPVIVHTGYIELNTAGCIALLQNDPQGKGCAGKYQAGGQCTTDACSVGCPVSDDATFAAEQKCETDAADGTCKKLVDDAGCADALVDAGAVSKCVAAPSFDALFDQVVPIFCVGDATSDGGTEAGPTDAATDGADEASVDAADGG